MEIDWHIFGKKKTKKLEVPDTVKKDTFRISRYWLILEHFWCSTFARNVIFTFFNWNVLVFPEVHNTVPVSWTSSSLFPFLI